MIPVGIVGSTMFIVAFVLLPFDVFTVTVALPNAIPSTVQVSPSAISFTFFPLSLPVHVKANGQSVPRIVACNVMDSPTATVALLLSSFMPVGAALTVTVHVALILRSSLE